MKSITDLKDSDIIEINGEKYQVLAGGPPNSLWYHADRNDVEYGVDLVKLGSNAITPTHQLRYFSKKPGEFRFYRLGQEAVPESIATVKF